MREYYATAGENGFAVYTEYTSALMNKKYLRHSTIRAFSTESEAFEFAIDYYNQYQNSVEGEPYYGSVDELSLDWMLFRSDIKKMNYENYV